MTENYRAAVLEALGLKEEPDETTYGPNDCVMRENTVPFAPDIDDLARLYRLARERKATTILEFGSGFSTAVLSQALVRNEQDFGDDSDFKMLRRNNPFELHTIDCNFDWLRRTQDRLLGDAKKVANIHHSTVTIGTFQDRICHFYDSIPNITPDFIYLDGPSSFDVSGHVSGLSFNHMDRTVIAADLARMEWLLLPGTMILVDGRTNNARFLKQNFQRNWAYDFDPRQDVHTFELQEAPLGDLNRKQIEFCLGAVDWI